MPGRVILTIKNTTSQAQSVWDTGEKEYSVISYQFSMYAGEVHYPKKGAQPPLSTVPTVGDRWLHC